MARRKAGQLAVWNEFGEEAGKASSGSQLLKAAQGKEEQASEVQAWLTTLHQQWEAAPQDDYFKLLRGNSGKAGDQTVKVINQARSFIAKVYPFNHAPGAIALNTPHKARCCLYLYHRLLFNLMTRAIEDACDGQSEAAPKVQDAAVRRMLQDEELLLGMLNCCVEVVNYAFLEDDSRTFPTATIALGRIHHTLELWQAVDWLAELCGPADEAAGIPAMPGELLGYLGAVQTRIEEELAFVDQSSIYQRMVASGTSEEDLENDSSAAKRLRRKSRLQGGGGVDSVLIARFMSNLVTTAMARTAVVCRGLLDQHPELQRVADLPIKCCTVLDITLYDQLHVLFNQHLSCIIACCIAFTLRLHDTPFSFRKIADFMAATLDNHDQETFSNVEIPAEAAAGPGVKWGSEEEIMMGDCKQFYHSVFLPAMEQYTANDLFEDSISCTTQPEPSPAVLEAADDEPPAPVASLSLSQPMKPLRPLPATVQFSRRRGGGSGGSAGAAGGSGEPRSVAKAAPAVLPLAVKAGRSRGAQLVAKSVGAAGGSGGLARRPLGQVDRNQARG